MAIDFDGTNDGYTADVTALGSNSAVLVQGFLNYDLVGGAGNRTIFRYSGSGSGDEVQLLKNGATLSFSVIDASGPAATNVDVSLSGAGIWHGFQCYADNTALGVRVWTTGYPGSFSTGTARTIGGLDTFVFGYTGSSQYFNGRLAEMYVSQYSPGVSTSASHFARITDVMAATGRPLSVLPLLYDELVVQNGVNIGMYWRMLDNADLYDALQKKQLTAVDSPSSSQSHPRLRN